MDLFIVIIGTLFTLFSTLILSYISMATMVGPWIAPTLVLLGHILLKMYKSCPQKAQTLTILQAIGAGGGLIATGIGFGLPTLFFLEPETFNMWLENPWYFIGIVSWLCLCAGAFGLLLGRWMQHPLLDTQKLPFPVSMLTHQVITSQNHPSQAKKLAQGVSLTFLICALRDGFWTLSGIIEKTYYLFPSFAGREIALTVWPTLWAIGFSVGISIALPLFVGMIAKYLVVYPLAQHANFLPFSLFEAMTPDTFTIAFCSGLVVCELIFGLPTYIKNVVAWLNRYTQKNYDSVPKESASTLLRHSLFAEIMSHKIQWLVTLVGSYALFSFFEFSALSQVLLILFTILASYSISSIGGKIGLVPFGRFSTFIVIPLLLLFQLTPIQATIAIVFFNICAAASSDLLFDYKIADLTGIKRSDMYLYQWIGLTVTALSIGFFLWLLFTNLTLGSEALFAQRGKAKALLLQSLNFNMIIVGIGVVFGWILKKFKVNPTMVFGGLIMPNSVTIGLIAGSLATKTVSDENTYQPLCAGILAAESLWIIVTILSRMG